MSWGTLMSNWPVDELAAVASAKEYESWERTTPWPGATTVPPCEAQSCAATLAAETNSVMVVATRSERILLFMVTSSGQKVVAAVDLKLVRSNFAAGPPPYIAAENPVPNSLDFPAFVGQNAPLSVSVQWSTGGSKMGFS